MRRALIALTIFLIAGSCSSPSADPVTPAPDTRAPERHVIVVSIDGLMTATYLEPDARGLKVPTLRKMRSEGAYSPGMESVFPSVTYPAHTSMVTGVNPGTHGIITNLAWDPFRRNKEGWNWYTEAIRVPTLWQVARQQGMRTALIHWPVTVGADVHSLVPDFWRARNREDMKLTRALSTPGLLDGVAARFPEFLASYEPWKPSARSAVEIAIHLIETDPPELMLLHTLKVDHYQHHHGLWSDKVKARIEDADAQLGRLMQAIERAGIADRTILMVVSDHGFLPVHTRMRPSHVLEELGLTPAGENNDLSSWKASVLSADGTAYLYVADPDDQATRDLLGQTFRELAGKPGSGIKRVFEQDEIRARGGDPDAFLALEPSDGFRFSNTYGGEKYSKLVNKACHGFPPDRPEMAASLLVHGPAVQPGVIEGARIIDLAPTIADWLGFSMPDVEGKKLPIALKPRS